MIKKLFPIFALAGVMFSACHADQCCLYSAISITHNDLLKSALEDVLIFPAAGEEQEYLLSSAMSWMITDGMPLPAWLHIYDTSGPAGSNQLLKITTDVNPFGEPEREHLVTFAAPNGFKLTLLIRQLEDVFSFRVGINYSDSGLDEIINVPTLDLLTLDRGKPHTERITSIDLLDFPVPHNFLVGRFADEIVELRFDETTGDLLFRDADGSGFIPIGSHAELYMAHNSDKNFLQEADIDLSGEEWHANSSSTFIGIYNGDNHVLTGMKTTSGPLGIFNDISGTAGGTVENLGIIDPELDGGSGGAFAFQMSSSATITNCYVSGGTISGASVGSLTNKCDGGGLISKCYSSATVDGSADAAGLVVAPSSTVTIQYCYFTGEVTATNVAGGIFASASAVTPSILEVSHCYTTGNVSGGTNVGGIGGTGNRVLIQYCYATGAVSSTSLNAGGILGNLGTSGSNSLFNCCALNASVTGVLTGTGRVVGNVLAGVLTSNAAFDVLGVLGSGGATTKDGFGIIPPYATSASFWTSGITSPAFSWTSGWSTTIWYIENGKLPTLIGVGGVQDGTPPFHLL